MTSKKHLKDTDLAHRYDFDKRKPLHVSIMTETKKEFKHTALRLDMPMQQIVECLVQLVIDENPYVIRKLNEYRIFLENKEADTFTEKDADALFAMMQDGDDD